MRKLKATILSLAALSALTFAGAAELCAQNQPFTASAETPVIELISPTDYQQYLPLLAPTAVTATEAYTAIADGKTVHVYDAADKLYREYTHTDAVAQVLFDGDNNLYFLSEYKLWKIAASDLKQASPTPTDLNIVCPGFTVQENYLYYSTMSKKSIKRYDLTSGTTDEFPLENSLQDSSPLAFGKGKLHCVCETESGYSVFEIDPDSKNTKPLASFDEQVASIAIANNLFCAITKSGAFRVYNINNLSGEPITDTTLNEADIGGYVAAYAKGDDVYVIRGNSVRVYDTETQAFTDFEINAASSSPHRLNGANELYLSKNKLFIADDGNDRISVYNTTKGSFEKSINSTLPSPFLSSYGETLLVSSAQEAALYSLKAKGYGETLLSIPTEELNGSVVGATCVYDRYYLLTDGGYCYTLTQTGDAWGYVKTQTLPYATAITADVYGSLYVLYDDGDVHQFTEREFTTPNASGTKILEIESETAKLSIDYEGNLYALSENVLTKYSLQGDVYAQAATFSPSYNLVKDDSPSLLSFAFGVENEYTYFLYENNYLIKSDELQIPTVNPILVGEAADRLFGADNRDFALVKVHKDAILTEFDFAALKGADKFPYLAFERCYSPITALKIGEENGHAILAVAAGATGYKTYLVENENCTVLPESEYRVVYQDQTQTGNLTNGVSLYKFPYLSSLLTVIDMPRGATVTLLGEITQLDHAYYEIAYTAESGETKTGYIPKNYVLLFDGSSATPETVTYGNTEDDTDAVWRLTYILLGLAAIGILTDFLLLYKVKKSNNE